ncbi:EAL domain-containing protein [Bacillus sp. FJAT-49736]|uniref:EAL domain-containing protein n=1 Tax=Bacillus sp. FJAT-49736 TaxID=2833582 RepID=UPI001BC9804B|nr:EAL domain-containing protein [Bacillus sp. FJAT-49736]MBS4172320.1 EAL domain-containing protein [Bacillus sp. FJAT-49736]
MKQTKDTLKKKNPKHPKNVHEEKMLRDIFLHQISDMVFIMKVEPGPKFRYTFVNQKGLDLANLKEEHIGSLIEEVLPKDTADYLINQYKKVLETKETVTFTDYVQVNENKIRMFESCLTGITDENSIPYIIGITRDVTDYSETRQKYQSIIDHNLDAIFSVNENGRIISTNPASLKMIGYSELELMNHSIFELVDKDGVKEIYRVMSNTLLGEPQETKNCTFIKKDGVKLHAQLKTVPIMINREVTGIYVIIRDTTEQWRTNEKMNYMAMHDHLTGLWNRPALLEHLQTEITKSMIKEQEFALIYFDIDRFKYFNDTLGHQAGDELLKQTSDRLLTLNVSHYHVYRLGGDEFVIILPNMTKKVVERVVGNIISLFHTPFNIHDQDYYLTPSIGISLFPTDGKDAETLIKNADSALIQVKEKGKGHYRFYRSEMNEAFPNYILMEAHLRKAIQKNEFVMHYQPQVNLVDGKIKSFEALIRWNNRKFGFVSPAQFIPLAEETGLIISIGEWVINTVCEQLSIWRKKGFEDIRVAINISPKQLLDPNLPTIIKKALLFYQLPPSSIEIEVTEGAMEDTGNALFMLRRLKDMGLIISVDDFGTGYSSLNYLKRFPIDIIKIDQSFVREIQVNEKDAAITKTIINLAHNLGMEVIAEGVEERDQVQFLISAQCLKAQGFYFSRPVSAEEIEKNVLYI